MNSFQLNREEKKNISVSESDFTDRTGLTTTTTTTKHIHRQPEVQQTLKQNIQKTYTHYVSDLANFQHIRNEFIAFGWTIFLRRKK